MSTRFLALVAILLLAVVMPLQAAYKEGVEYKRISPAQVTASADKVEVVELFWYGCPHCHRFQPYVEKWLETAPDNVEYIRMPAILNASWAFYTRTFFAAQAIGVLDKVHMPLFNAIHTQKRRLNSERALVKFMEELGVDGAAFQKAFNSFGVDSKVRRAKQMTRRYQTEGTPSVIINGKYRVDAGMMTGGFAGMIKVMDYLVELESAKAH